LAHDWTHVLAGDCGSLITESGHVQFFEPYLIRHSVAASHQNDIVHGVQLHSVQRRIRYYIAEEDNNPYSTTFNVFTPVETRDPLGRRQFFHMYHGKRLSLTRGVSAFAPIFILTGMLEDVNFSKLVHQQIVSCIAYLIEEADVAGNMPSTTGIGNAGHQTSETSTSGETQLFDKLEPGMEVNPGAGRKVTGFSPQIPNAEYFQQYRLILQLICGNLDLPLSVGMMDSSETNFHGFIGAANEAKKAWKKSQRRLDQKFHTPLTIAKFFQFADEDPAMKRAMARLGEKFFDFTWHKPVWQSVKALEDTNDRLQRLKNGIISPTKMHAELNSDYPTHVEETVRDNALAIRMAKREAIAINSDPELQDGQPIHWSQLYPMPTPEGVQATAMIEPEPEPVEEPSETPPAASPGIGNRLRSLLGN
jgi:capsid protein